MTLPTLQNALSGSVLKIIALCSMTVDHITLFVFDQAWGLGDTWICEIMRCFGRIAFPVFAFLQKGEDLTSVVEEFLNDYETADLIVGHNIDFDKNVVGAEIIRIGLKDIIDTKPSVCTMKSSTDYRALYTEYGYKWPTLQELYKELFDESFDDAHNSASDVAATERCFWELRHLKTIP